MIDVGTAERLRARPMERGQRDPHSRRDAARRALLLVAFSLREQRFGAIRDAPESGAGAYGSVVSGPREAPLAEPNTTVLHFRVEPVDDGLHSSTPVAQVSPMRRV